MNVFKKLEGVTPSSSKMYRSFTELDVGYHRIFCVRETKTKYGRGIIIELKDGMLFLPRYLAQRLDENDVVELNSYDENIYLYFGGRCDQNT